MSNLMDSIIENCRLQNITQRELAKKSGITETSISRYFNGERNPNIKNAEKMASALGLVIVMINESILESDCAKPDKTNRTDDVCEWKKSNYPFDWLVGCDGCKVNHRQGNYCPRCGKKIKIVGD